MQQRVDRGRLLRSGGVGFSDSGSGPRPAADPGDLRGERLRAGAVAGDLAGLGYVVAAPDLFWRLQPGSSGPHTVNAWPRRRWRWAPVRRHPGRRGLRGERWACWPRSRGGWRHRESSGSASAGRSLTSWSPRRRSRRGGLVLRLGRARKQRGLLDQDRRAGAVPASAAQPVCPAGQVQAQVEDAATAAQRGHPRRGNSRARLPQPEGAHVPPARAGGTGLAAHRGIPPPSPARPQRRWGSRRVPGPVRPLAGQMATIRRICSV